MDIGNTIRITVKYTIKDTILIVKEMVYGNGITIMDN